MIPLPSLLVEPHRWVCVVVDVLRASTSLATMFARGLEEAVIAGSVEEARRLAAEGNYLLCGEVGGLPPAGFDYGNSPTEFSALDLRGRRAVFVTSNGTKALGSCADAPCVLVGSLVNASAVCHVAQVEAKQRGVGVAFVCAGNSFGTRFSLDDMVACGVLVKTLAKLQGKGVHWNDGALAAQRLSAAYGDQALLAFRESAHGQELRRIGLARDLTFCAQVDRSDVVPMLAQASSGRLRLHKFVVD